MTVPEDLMRLAKMAVLVMLGCFAALWFIVIFSGGVGPPGQDLDSPWLAAMRLRHGAPLYDPNPATGYGYAP